MKVDSRGHSLETPRGPKREHRTVHVSLPDAMADELEARARVHPERLRKSSTGRSPVVRDALTLLFAGDADTWRRRFLDERKRRIQAEAALQRVRDAVGLA